MLQGASARTSFAAGFGAILEQRAGDSEDESALFKGQA